MSTCFHPDASLVIPPFLLLCLQMASKVRVYRPPTDLYAPLPSSSGSEPSVSRLRPQAADPNKPSIAILPPEIHLLIASHLTYPDALSLKHASRSFHELVYTGVHLKIEWLIERRRLHLDCPVDIGKGCELGSDIRFCRGSVG